MEAKELRIGNLLHFPFTNENIEILGINAHEYSNGIFNTISFKKDTNLYFEQIEELKPIPLTEEWLLNFGFETCGYDLLFWQHKKIKGLELGGINWADKGYKEYQFLNYQIGDNIFSIDYVHQLQNLYFALTKEELTIKKQ